MQTLPQTLLRVAARWAAWTAHRCSLRRALHWATLHWRLRCRRPLLWTRGPFRLLPRSCLSQPLPQPLPAQPTHTHTSTRGCCSRQFRWNSSARAPPVRRRWYTTTSRGSPRESGAPRGPSRARLLLRPPRRRRFPAAPPVRRKVRLTPTAMSSTRWPLRRPLQTTTAATSTRRTLRSCGDGGTTSRRVGAARKGRAANGSYLRSCVLRRNATRTCAHESLAHVNSMSQCRSRSCIAFEMETWMSDKWLLDYWKALSNSNTYFKFIHIISIRVVSDSILIWAHLLNYQRYILFLYGMYRFLLIIYPVQYEYIHSKFRLVIN